MSDIQNYQAEDSQSQRLRYNADKNPVNKFRQNNWKGGRNKGKDNNIEYRRLNQDIKELKWLIRNRSTDQQTETATTDVKTLM